MNTSFKKLKTLIFVFFAVSVMTFSSVAQRRAVWQNWQEFTPTEAGFTVSLPGEPDELLPPQILTERVCSTMKAYRLTTSAMVYHIYYCNSPESADKEKFIRAVWESYGGEINQNPEVQKLGIRATSDKDLSKGAIIGRELTLEKDLTALRLQAFFTKGKYYVIAVTKPLIQNSAPHLTKILQDDENKFFNSFRIFDTVKLPATAGEKSKKGKKS